MPLLFWILNGLYGCLLLLVSPVVFYRMLTQGKYRQGWPEKLWGALPIRNDSTRPAIWCHAVSVGEVLLLQPVLKEWENQITGYDVVISTTTSTGYQVACEKFPQHHVCYFPLDFSWAVNNALKRIQPDLLVLVELELWPNMIFAASRAKIPLVLINGRISERSFKGYSRIRLLMKPLLACFDLCIMQNEDYAERLLKLGARPNSVHISGSIKYDHLEVDRNNSATTDLKRLFQLSTDEIVWIAGSTQSPEEKIALSVWQRLVKEFPQLRLILVPRHRERFEEVSNLVNQMELPLRKRSEQSLDKCSGESTSNLLPEVCLLDTLGELSACWGLADFAFVGGSLTRRGGQNMIEPSAFGAVVMFGPNTWNFKDVVKQLLKHQAGCIIADADELYCTLRHFLLNPEEATVMGRNAQDFVTSQQGATRKTAGLIQDIIDQECSTDDLNQSAA